MYPGTSWSCQRFRHKCIKNIFKKQKQVLNSLLIKLLIELQKFQKLKKKKKIRDS